jgi:hypothetical protein
MTIPLLPDSGLKDCEQMDNPMDAGCALDVKTKYYPV